MSLPVCELKPGRDRSIRRRHPWIFSGALAFEPDAAPGDLVDVFSSQGEFLGRGAYNPNSQIRVRIFSFEDEEIDAEFFIRRLDAANKFRLTMLPENTNCYRACFADGDRIPGLIIDNYDGFIVLQFQTAAIEAQRHLVIEAIKSVFEPKSIYERSVGGFRQDEGLEKSSGLIDGIEPPDLIEVMENGFKVLVDAVAGQKTGMFLDQREARQQVRNLAEGKTVLNVFSYSGAFALAALVGKAQRVVNVDSSSKALDLAKRNYEINDFAVDDNDFIDSDAFEYLRNDESKFDIVILDPPAFCKSQAGIPKALRGYKEIIMQGLSRLNPSGLLFCLSCSGHIDSAMFQKVVFSAAFDVGKEVQILKKLGHGFDHPINIYHPEGEYLCGFIIHFSE